MQTTEEICRLIKNHAWNLKGFPLNFVIKLNMQIAEVQCYFIAKTSILSRFVTICITLTTTEQ